MISSYESDPTIVSSRPDFFLVQLLVRIYRVTSNDSCLLC